VSYILVCALAIAAPLLALADEPRSLEEAEAMVRAYVLETEPRMNPSARFPLRDITPAAAWNALHLQVFRITEDIQENWTYLIREDVVYPIGGATGGQGVTSMVVADLNRDGTPEFYCSSSWGSGLPRASISAFLRTRSGWRTIECPQWYPFEHLLLEATADTLVTIYDASPHYPTGSRSMSDATYARGKRLGEIELFETSGEPELGIRVRD
jgi:hypothetical protein